MNKGVKLLYDIGIIDADYAVYEYITIIDENGKKKRKLVWTCPFYAKWKSMLTRCYCDKHQVKYPTYIGCSVCEEWLTFSNFKSWMENEDWEEKHLDKDLLFRGNKVYSPETCVFVLQRVNIFLTDRAAARGEFMIGVHWSKQAERFTAYGNDATGKRKHLGCFDTEHEAHQAWLKFKQKVACELATEQTDPRVAEALRLRYKNYPSIENKSIEMC